MSSSSATTSFPLLKHISAITCSKKIYVVLYCNIFYLTSTNWAESVLDILRTLIWSKFMFCWKCRGFAWVIKTCQGAFAVLWSAGKHCIVISGIGQTSLLVDRGLKVPKFHKLLWKLKTAMCTLDKLRYNQCTCIHVRPRQPRHSLVKTGSPSPSKVAIFSSTCAYTKHHKDTAEDINFVLTASTIASVFCR